jgi:hypothetical protein
MFVLGQEIVMSNNVKVTIPYADLVFTLIGMTIPLAIGLLIQKHKPDWAEISIKFIRPITIIFFILTLGGGLNVNLHLLKVLNWNIIAAGMCGVDICLELWLLFSLNSLDPKLLLFQSRLHYKILALHMYYCSSDYLNRNLIWPQLH